MSETPVAIVGIACRLPGIERLETLWDVLLSGGCQVARPDAERLSLMKLGGQAAPREGGFLAGIDRFDAGFFGISPREARRMDPSQRLACEVGFEAIEDAGLSLSTLSASPTGVFAGQWVSDYGHLLRRHLRESDLHCVTGNTSASLSGRLSHCFDLKGPCLSLDTSCSSSLVALHLACQSLRSGEVERALVVGVNLVLGSDMTEAFNQAGMLASDDRCKFGDLRGDGFVRSEGIVAMVLERLDLTRARQGKVWARICSSAVNHDGADGEYVAPSESGQKALLRLAYLGHGLSPGSVQYVECHGTGTRIGDGVELRSLGAVLGQGREPGNKLRVGSVKTNLGHAEAASGLVGLTKVCLALKHRWLPAIVGFQTPRDDVDWELLELQRQGEPWPASGPVLQAGVSSFGLTGVNAHVVVASDPEADRQEGGTQGCQLLALSARSREALEGLKRRYLDWLHGDQPPLARVCAAAARQRSHFEFRYFLVAEHLSEALEALAKSPPGHRAKSAPQWVFVFPGQGGQWPGMGRQLYGEQEAFRATFDRCAAAMEPYLAGWKLHDLISGEPGEEIDRVQPSLFAIQMALCALLNSWGLRPSVVVGHSMGELAAACVAGRITLEEAARIIALRSRLLRVHASGSGAMALVELDWEAAGLRLEAFDHRLLRAARNSRRATVIAGEPAALRTFVQGLNEEGIFARLIPVDIASHSPAVQPTGDVLREVLGAVSWADGTCDFVSTVAGVVDPRPALDADYWVENLVRPVYFQDAIERLAAEGHRHFLEISPHPVLQASILETCPEAECLPAMRRQEDERRVLLEVVGKLYQSGAEVAWEAFYPQAPALDLPHYAWQRQSYWMEATRQRPGREHPLLGSRVTSTQGNDIQVYENELHVEDLPFLREHRLKDSSVLPAAASLEMVQAAWQASGWQRGPGLHISQMRWSEAMVLGEVGLRVQLTLRRNGQGASFQISSCERNAPGPANWTLNAWGHIGEGAPAPAAVAETRLGVGTRVPLGADDRYAFLQRLGLGYGTSFQGLREVWWEGRRLTGRICAPPALSPLNGVGIHPCLLDACLQLLALDERGRLTSRLAIPVGLENWRCYPDANGLRREWPREVWAVVERHQGLPQLRVVNDQGQVLAEAEQVHLREVGAGLRLRRGEVGWAPIAPAPAKAASGPWLVFADRGGTAESLKPYLPACRWIYRDDKTALASLASLAEHPSILYLWGLDAVGMEEELLNAVPELLRTWPTPSALALVTGGLFDEQGQPNLTQAALWGCWSSLINEYPGCRTLALDCGEEQAGGEALARLLVESTQSGRLRLHGGQVWHQRLQAVEQEPVSFACPTSGEESALALTLKEAGELESLELVPRPLPQAGARQVVVEVEAVGLNYINLLSALGVYPGRPDGVGPLALECAGRITAVGSEVEELSVGDRVMAVAYDCAATHVCAEADLVVQRPPGFTPAQAAACPIAFLTAMVAFDRAGGLHPGMRVLIHSASGGVGWAALQWARRAGAMVLATAGSEQRREALRQQGVAVVMDSRSTDFRHLVLAATGGAGVDLVLNTLIDEGLEASLEVLAPGGLLLDLAKAGVEQGRSLPQRAFRSNRGYLAIDLDSLIRQRPASLTPYLRQLSEELANASLQPPPLSETPFERAAEAFHKMARGDYLGKLVLDLKGRPLPRGGGSWTARSDRTYLITGASGAIGQELMAWLVARGARHLALIGRRPPTMISTSAQGVEVIHYALDFANLAEVAPLLRRVQSQQPPLAGVFHLAGKLADGLASTLSAEQMREVLQPKLMAAGALAEALEGLPLDFMVFFSSISGLLGIPSQANYAAANLALEALARGLRQRGLPASSIAFGWWGECLGLVDSERRQNHLRSSGIRPLPSGALLGALEETLRDGLVHSVVCELDRQAWGSAWPTPSNQWLAEEWLTASPERPCESESGVDFQKERLDFGQLKQLLSQTSAQLLGGDPTQFDWHRTWKEQGLDSLLSMQLRSRLESHLGLKLLVSMTLNYPTPEALVKHLWEQLAPPPVEAKTEDDTDLDELAAELAELNDEQILQSLSRADG